MKRPLHNMAAIGLCAAVTAVSAWVCVPAAVPFTLQSFAVCMAACLLGGRKSAAAVGIYLAVGAVGVPVFAGFRGGLSVLLGPTGGFLWGFAVMAVLAGGLLSHGRPAPLALSVGQLACYLCGAAQFLAVSGGTLWSVLLVCVLPYIIPDALKIAAACAVVRRIGREVRS